MIPPEKIVFSIQALLTNLRRPFLSPSNKSNDLSKIKDKHPVSFDQIEQIRQKNHKHKQKRLFNPKNSNPK